MSKFIKIKLEEYKCLREHLQMAVEMFAKLEVSEGIKPPRLSAETKRQKNWERILEKGGKIRPKK